MENQNNEGKKSNKTKWVLLGLGLLTGVSVFSYQYWKKNQTAKTVNTSLPPSKTAQTNTPKPSLKDSIKSFFNSIKKKPAAPKDTTAASASKTKGTKANTFDAKKAANDFHAVINTKDFKKANDLLKTLKTSANYNAANKIFGLRGIKPSIATKLISTFNTAEQKKSLEATLTAIGLKYNGKKWSLAGLEESPLLITTKSTQVWKDPHTPINVPANMVLGTEVTVRAGFTLFENDNQKFLVKTGFVKHYQNNNS